MAKVITIDGPSASGKSTYGKLLASKIDFIFIDSGIFYRAGALGILNLGGPFKTEMENINAFKKVTQSLKILGEQVILQGKDITDKLHSLEVNQLTPIIAAIPQVREVVKYLQKRLVKGKDVIIAGRDIGTAIFPKAKLKFYITASPEVRAKRRYKQYQKDGKKITLESIISETKERDLKDTTRSASPLTIPQGAVTIDTSNLTVKESLEKMMENFKKLYFKQ